ncbi:PTS sugar transporter subunit IIA [Lactococcus ileimucosae]|uniref:PTS sugar transporter subunit IIA n=1 Tax=Lactococcus ileimucosae TaxID=2941329 RepID=UPI003516EECC
MFGFRKKKEKNLYMPVAGEIVELAEVDDPVFSQKMMGDGFAVEPSGEIIFAPLSGTIMALQGHAVGFKREDGLECLLHLGLDTVSLEGEPFSYNIAEGDVVTGGQEIGRVDWKKVEDAGLKKTSMLVFTSMTMGKQVSFSVNQAIKSAGELVGHAEFI